MEATWCCTWALGMNYHDLEDIFEKHSGDHSYAAWAMLIQWRDTSKATTDRRAILTGALRKLNRQYEPADQSPVSTHGKLMGFVAWVLFYNLQSLTGLF